MSFSGPPAEEEYGADEEGDLVLVSRNEDEGRMLWCFVSGAEDSHVVGGGLGGSCG